MKANRAIDDLRDLDCLTSSDLRKYGRLFSPFFGLINALLRRFELERYGFAMFQSRSAETKALFDLPRSVSSGGLGINTSERKALQACIGESVERYCMSFVNQKILTLSTRSGLSADARPKRLALYSPCAYGKTRAFSNPNDAKIRWVKLTGINGAGLYWPASLIYIPYNLEKPVAETTSTGVAAHSSLIKAVTGGLLEVIERDAMMINHYQRLNPPVINLDTITGANKNLINKVRADYGVKIYKLRSDINIPIFLCLIWTENRNGLHFGIGACADLDSDVAIEKAVKESLFTYFYSKKIGDLKPRNKGSINKLYEHFLYYQNDSFFRLFPSQGAVGYQREKYGFGHLNHELRKNGYSAYYIDITTPDVRSAGLRVVKSVIPGFIDLSKTYGLERSESERYVTVPKKLGFPRALPNFSLPHPFP